MVTSDDAREMVRRSYKKGYDIDGILESFSSYEWVMLDEYQKISGHKYRSPKIGGITYRKKITPSPKYTYTITPTRIKEEPLEVKIPLSILKAGTTLSSVEGRLDPTRDSGAEYGGAFDFEKKCRIVGSGQFVCDKKKGDMEKMITYYAGEGFVPAEIISKYSDYEVKFHTHPDRNTAIPSFSDVESFLCGDQQVSMIFSDNDIKVLKKTKDTKGCFSDKLSEYKESLEGSDTARDYVLNDLDIVHWVHIPNKDLKFHIIPK